MSDHGVVLGALDRQVVVTNGATKVAQKARRYGARDGRARECIDGFGGATRLARIGAVTE